MINYFEKPMPTKNSSIWIIGRQLNQWDRHSSWINHFGTFEGAVKALAGVK